MTSKTSYVILLAIVISIGTQHAIAEIDISDLETRNNLGISIRDIQSMELPDEHLKDVTKALKSRLKSKRFLGQENQMLGILLALGDEETLKSMLLEFRTSAPSRSFSVSNIIRKSENPKIIKYLEEDMFLEESAKLQKYEEMLGHNRSVVACEIVRHLIENSDDFEEEVRIWASNQQAPDDATKFRNIIRIFYLTNKSYFLKDEFNKIQVPENLFGDHNTNSDFPQMLIDEVIGTTPKANQKAEAVQVKEPKSASFPWLWIGAIAVIAGVAALLVIQRQRA